MKAGVKIISALMIIALMALLCGCTVLLDVMGGGPKRQPDPSAKGMYEDAQDLMKKKKYEKASEAFRKIKEEHPLSEYTPLSELRRADAFYYDKNYPEAMVLYEEFKKLHPLHAEVPFAIYQLGMCHFKQLPTVDRDQTETQKAMEQFRYLIENFPQSPHAAEGRKRLRMCQKQLAEHELYIAHFYLRFNKYRAAMGRLEGILEKYPEVGFENKVKPLIQKCQKGIAKDDEETKKKEAKEGKKKKAAQTKATKAESSSAN